MLMIFFAIAMAILEKSGMGDKDLQVLIAFCFLGDLMLLWGVIMLVAELLGA